MEQERNLWVIPTDEPSRLWKNNLLQGKLELSEEVLPYNTSQNIYITSDEEIKEGDWCIDDKYKQPMKYFGEGSLLKSSKKIILTDNKDLIKDGVQAIDNEFLEWFVKNPSCEFVEVEKFRSFKEIHSPYEYMIIIPKEETKFEDSIENSINIMSIANSMFSKKEEPKQSVKEYEQQGLEKYSYELEQETLEEAAERILANNIDGLRDALQDDDLFFFYKGVIQCYGEAMVEWQQEQDKKMYSEVYDVQLPVAGYIGDSMANLI